MTIISDECRDQIALAMANARSDIDITLPLGEDFTLRITSEWGNTPYRERAVQVTVSTRAVLPDEDESPYVYLHEVNETGERLVEEWKEAISELHWADDQEWDFMLQKRHNPPDKPGGLAEYAERTTVNTEDLIASTKNDEQLVRVSYTVPREMYAVVEEDVDLDELDEVAMQVPNLGFNQLPLVDLEPEMVKPSLTPHDDPNIPTVPIQDVEDASVEVVDPESDED